MVSSILLIFSVLTLDSSVTFTLMPRTLPGFLLLFGLFLSCFLLLLVGLRPPIISNVVSLAVFSILWVIGVALIGIAGLIYSTVPVEEIPAFVPGATPTMTLTLTATPTLTNTPTPTVTSTFTASPTLILTTTP